MSRLLENLNDRQREAVETTSGPLLIIAGAGSGKTRVLTRRIAYILTERLAEPWQLLSVTFTNKAAGEMRDRVSELLGGEIPGLTICTFHSFSARFLRQEAELLGYDRKYTIFDSADSVTLVKNCIKDLHLSSSQFTPKAQLRKISQAKNQLIDCDTFASGASGYFETTTAEIYSLYQQRLRDCDAMDFDDLLFNTVHLLTSHRETGEKYRTRFKYLMVDEYQDTNHVQYLLLKNLAGDNGNLCVVGDEDQSIYRWRGADIRNILEFEQDYPGCTIIKLEQNYRSTSLILAAASSVIKNNESRKPKTLWTDQEGGDRIRLLMVDTADLEAAEVVHRVMDKESNDTRLKEIAVLYRTNAQSRPFEEHLRRHDIPYQIIGGISFYQRKEIKDLMAYLRLIVNGRDDISFERIINSPKRGIGDKSVTEIAKAAKEQSRPYLEIAVAAMQIDSLARRGKKLEEFARLIETYRQKSETTPLDLLAGELVEELKLFEEFLSEDPIIGQTRIENIEAFLEGMAEFARSRPEASLAEYLADISLFTDLDDYKEIDDKLTLMTVHSAKGLEYDTVFIVGLEEGLFPLGKAFDDPMDLEEERRLFYVGSTRARKRLYISTATTRYRFGEVESLPSRFIKEIPEELIEKFDMRTVRRYQYSESLQQTRLFPDFAQKEKKQTAGVHYEYEADEIMRPGRIVQHPTFGRGRIIKSEGLGESLRLEINFTAIGIKKIMARFARLKIVG